MVLGAMTHVALWVSDRDRSEAFYERVLGLLGYRRTAQTDEFTTWWSPRAGAVTISPIPATAPAATHATAGLHHLAFTADSRDQIDAFHRHLQTLGIPVVKTASLASPAEDVDRGMAPTAFDNSAANSSAANSSAAHGAADFISPTSNALGNCYAVLFKDPDGLCLELVYMASK